MAGPTADFLDPPESSPEDIRKDGRRAGAAIGPGLTRIGVYERSVRASVWERTSQVAFSPGDPAPVRAQLRDMLADFVDLYREGNAPDPAPEAAR